MKMSCLPVLAPSSKAVLAAALALLWSASARAEHVGFDCVIDPMQKVKVGSAVTGVLKAILVQRGDPVTLGQPVAQLESAIEEANVELARARAEANENVEAQQARLDLANKRLIRAQKLAKSELGTIEKLEQAEADANIARHDLDSEMLKKRIAGIELKRDQVALDLRTIKSSVSGLVIEKHLSAGEFVNQEAYIMTLVQLDPLYVETYVPVAYWGRIAKGTKGHVLPAPPIGGSYEAPVTVVDHVFDAASGTYGARLELANPDLALPAGQRCRVEFDVPDAVVESSSAAATR
jgi:RND family efflux transporter MFP subunit